MLIVRGATGGYYFNPFELTSASNTPADFARAALRIAVKAKGEIEISTGGVDAVAVKVSPDMSFGILCFRIAQAIKPLRPKEPTFADSTSSLYE